MVAISHVDAKAKSHNSGELLPREMSVKRGGRNHLQYLTSVWSPEGVEAGHIINSCPLLPAPQPASIQTRSNAALTEGINIRGRDNDSVGQ